MSPGIFSTAPPSLVTAFGLVFNEYRPLRRPRPTLSNEWRSAACPKALAPYRLRAASGTGKPRGRIPRPVLVQLAELLDQILRQIRVRVGRVEADELRHVHAERIAIIRRAVPGLMFALQLLDIGNEPVVLGLGQRHAIARRHELLVDVAVARP